MIVRVKAHVPWQVRPVGDMYIGVCEPLHLTVEGDTWSNLMESIGDTLDAVMGELMKSNELPQFLQSHGWALITPLPAKPQDVRFDVPFIPAMVGALSGPTGIVHK